LDPEAGHLRTYWVQVERIPEAPALRALENGLLIQGHRTRPARAWKLDPQPEMAPRNPPIRYRKSVPDCWIAIELCEGKNRQVRRMTAAVGHPTLRLVRQRIGSLDLGSLPAGQWRELSAGERRQVFGHPALPLR
jgi:23S rRNA pseudouridine2457 synthase